MNSENTPNHSSTKVQPPDSRSQYLKLALIGLLLPPLGLVTVIRDVARALKTKTSLFKPAILAILLFTLLGSLGYVALFRHSLNKDNLHTYVLSGQSPQTGMSFKQPPGFVKDNSTTKPVGFSQTTNGTVTGGLYANSTLFDKAYSSKFLADFNTAINNNDSQSEGYKNWRSNLTNLLESKLPPGYKISIGQQSSFTNSQIKSNAWKYDYTILHFENGSTRSMQGELVVALGKQTRYYFAFFTALNDWLNSQPTRQSVFNSLRIDQ